MLGTMSSIADLANAKDAPIAGISDAFTRCRLAQPRDLLFYSREPPRPTASRLRRSFSDHPHIQLSRNMDTVHSSYGDTVAVAVCVSLGGTGIVAMAIYVIMMYRRRQTLLDAQDTLPRPFEVTVPAATTGASMMTYGLGSFPVLNISPARERGGRGRREARREAIPARTGSLGAGTAPILTTTTPRQSVPRSSQDTRMRPRLSDTSLLSNHAGLSSYHTPPRSRTHPHTPIPPDPPSQSGSRAQPGQSSSSLPTGTHFQRTAGAPVTRSASVQEQRSAKRALWLSRSASELYRATSLVPRYRVPEYGSHTPSGRYASRHGGYELHVESPTSHLRQSHSASPLVHVHHVASGPEEDAGRAVILQHQDAGVMQELPPPYHKLV